MADVRKLKITDQDIFDGEDIEVVHYAGEYDGFTLCRIHGSEDGDPFDGTFDTDEEVNCDDCLILVEHVKKILTPTPGREEA